MVCTPKYAIKDHTRQLVPFQKTHSSPTFLCSTNKRRQRSNNIAMRDLRDLAHKTLKSPTNSSFMNMRYTFVSNKGLQENSVNYFGKFNVAKHVLKSQQKPTV